MKGDECKQTSRYLKGFKVCDVCRMNLVASTTSNNGLGEKK